MTRRRFVEDVRDSRTTWWVWALIAISAGFGFAQDLLRRISGAGGWYLLRVGAFSVLGAFVVVAAAAAACIKYADTHSERRAAETQTG